MFKAARINVTLPIQKKKKKSNGSEFLFRDHGGKKVLEYYFSSAKIKKHQTGNPKFCSLQKYTSRMKEKSKQCQIMRNKGRPLLKAWLREIRTKRRQEKGC